MFGEACSLFFLLAVLFVPAGIVAARMERAR
jgi:hypothetical protein